MDDKLLYIPNDDKENYPFFRLKLWLKILYSATIFFIVFLKFKMENVGSSPLPLTHPLITQLPLETYIGVIVKSRTTLMTVP